MAHGTIDEQAGPSSPIGEQPKWGYIKPGFFQWIREEWGENNNLIFYYDKNNSIATTAPVDLKRNFEIKVANIESEGGKSREIRIAILKP